MKCMCGRKDCTSEVGFDSGSGILIAEREGRNPIGMYLSVVDAITLTKQLRAYVLQALDGTEQGVTGWDTPQEAHDDTE